MNKGAIFAAVILALYIGVEAYAIRKVSHRIEPGYIHAMLVKAQSATEQCNSEALDYAPRFSQTLSRVTASYRQALADADPKLTSTDIDLQLNEEILNAQAAVTNAITSLGCADPELKAHFQRYRIYAKKTR